MTFAVTIPMWAIDTFMALGIATLILGVVKIALEIQLQRLKRNSAAKAKVTHD